MGKYLQPPEHESICSGHNTRVPDNRNVAWYLLILPPPTRAPMLHSKAIPVPIATRASFPTPPQHPRVQLGFMQNP